MFEIIFKTLITFFTVYALIDIFTKVINFFVSEGSQKGETFIVIKVKNQENNLEYIVRSIIWDFLTKSGGTKVPYILIVDVGSNDCTDKIAKRLCEDYEFIYYATEDKYNEMKKQLSI